MISDARVRDMAKTQRERLRHYEPDHLRLLLQIIRQLASGHPVTAEQVDRLSAPLGIAPDAAHQYMQATERDADGQIIGAMGLSLGDHPHRLSVTGMSLSAWCALDTLFLPALLQQTVTITSPSPLTHEAIRLRVSPERVEEVHPASAVISIVQMDPSRADRVSVEAMWSAFCHHVHFFATREEAEQWASGRDDIVILTVYEGFELGRQVWSAAFADVA